MPLLKNVALLIVCLFVGIGLGFAVGLAYGYEYETTSLVVIGFPPSRVPRLIEATGESQADIETLMRSPAVIRTAVEKYKLDLLPVFQSEPDIVEAIRSRISVTVVDPTASMYDVRIRSTDVTGARNICSALLHSHAEIFETARDPRKDEVFDRLQRANMFYLGAIDQWGSTDASLRSAGKFDLEEQRRREKAHRDATELLAERERELEEAKASSSVAIGEYVAQVPTFVLVQGGPNHVRKVRPYLRPTTLKGAILGAALGLLLMARRIVADRRSRSHLAAEDLKPGDETVNAQ